MIELNYYCPMCGHKKKVEHDDALLLYYEFHYILNCIEINIGNCKNLCEEINSCWNHLPFLSKFRYYMSFDNAFGNYILKNFPEARQYINNKYIEKSMFINKLFLGTEMLSAYIECSKIFLSFFYFDFMCDKCNVTVRNMKINFKELSQQLPDTCYNTSKEVDNG